MFSARVVSEAGNRRQERKSPVASGSMWGRRKGRRARATVGALTVSATWLLGSAPASAQVLLPGVDPGPIPDPLGAACCSSRERRSRPIHSRSRRRRSIRSWRRTGTRTSTSTPTRRTPTRIRGPLGETTTDSAFFLHECASITFDSQGRLVTICVGVERPILALLDPDTLMPLATYDAAAADSGGAAATRSPTSRAAATSTSTTRTGRSCRRPTGTST